MNWKRLLDVHSWPDLAIEAALRLRAKWAQPGELIGPLPIDVRDRLTVRWPRTYPWRPMAKWGDQILDMLRRRLTVSIADLPQRYRGTIVSEFAVDGTVHQVAFNISDYPDYVSEECTRASLVTFKFQFRRDGYPAQNVVPGGYLPSSQMLYDLLPYLRWAKDRRRSLFDVYGRFSMEFAPGVREDVLRQLADTNAFRFRGGDRVVRYSRYLREIARARICIDLPGQGPLCFRLVEYLAIGSCVVAIPHPVRFPTALLDGVHVAYLPDGAQDVIGPCRALLEDGPKRRAMELAARRFFDDYLHRDRLSAYYVRTVLAAAGAR